MPTIQSLTPILLGLFLPLDMYSRNTEYVWPGEFAQALAYYGTAVVLILTILRLLYRNTSTPLQRSALATSLLLIVTTAWNVVSALAVSLEPRMTCSLLWPLSVIGLLWGLSIISLIRRVARLETKTVRLMLSVFLVMAAVLWAQPLGRLMRIPSRNSSLSPVAPLALKAPQGTPPDIYYIILDGFARQDILRELYDLNDEHFLSELRALGFFVADKATSNYSQTLLSLGSSLNVEYLDTLLSAGRESFSRAGPVDLIRNNRIARSLRDVGYEFVAVSSGVGSTDLRTADRYLSYVPANALLEVLSSQIRLPVVGSLISRRLHTNHAHRVLAGVSAIASIRKHHRPQFVFAHILSPHPPFVLDSEGNLRYPGIPFSIADGLEAPHRNYREYYGEQVRLVSRLTLDSIRKLLSAHSTNRPIVVIQSDHGPGLTLRWDAMKEISYRERFSILEAVYLPSGSYEHFYPEISPVNVWRNIMRETFGAELSNLPDRSFFSTWNKPYQFSDVTEIVTRASKDVPVSVAGS